MGTYEERCLQNLHVVPLNKVRLVSDITCGTHIRIEREELVETDRILCIYRNLRLPTRERAQQLPS